MSRRLRIEEEKAKQLKDELQEEEDKLKLQNERIFGPLVWRRFQNGIQIQDLQEKLFGEAVNLILDCYMTEDVLFRNTKISQDPISKKSFSDRIIFKFKDHASIIAIDENNENLLVGVLVLNPVQKCDFGRVYSRTMLVEGNPYKSIVEFMNYINRKVDVFETFQCEIYLRYYLLCIRPEYRRRGLGFQLMLVGLDIARHLKIPIIMGLFNNYRMQKIARKLGFIQELYEYKYIKWSDPAGELVFCDPGAGNYTCAVLAGLVPPPPEPEPLPVTEDRGSKARMTRSDKKKMKAKIEAKRGSAN